MKQWNIIALCLIGLLIPTALNAMEMGLELGGEKSFRELSVQVELLVPNVRINNMRFNSNIVMVNAGVTEHNDQGVLQRFYTQSGARLHAQDTAIKLHADSYTAEVNLPYRPFANNSQNVLVNYTISKQSYCFFHTLLAHDFMDIPIDGSEGIYYAPIEDHTSALLVALKVIATWKEHHFDA